MPPQPTYPVQSPNIHAPRPIVPAGPNHILNGHSSVQRAHGHSSRHGQPIPQQAHSQAASQHACPTHAHVPHLSHGHAPAVAAPHAAVPGQATPHVTRHPSNDPATLVFDEFTRRIMNTHPLARAQKVWPCVPSCSAKLFGTLESLLEHMETCRAANAVAASHKLVPKQVQALDRHGKPQGTFVLSPVRQLTPVMVLVLHHSDQINSCPFDKFAPPHPYYSREDPRDRHGVPEPQYSVADGTGSRPGHGKYSRGA